jgi:hypothetical protein
MAYSIRETIQLRDVLMSLTNFIANTKRDIENISSERGLDRDRRRKLGEEIKTLEKALEIASSLVVFFEYKVMEEADAAALRRNMEDAKAICDAIRAAHHQQNQPAGGTAAPQSGDSVNESEKSDGSDGTTVWWSDDEETVYETPSKFEKKSMTVDKVGEKKRGKLIRLARSVTMPLRRSKTTSTKLPCISESSEGYRA